MNEFELTLLVMEMNHVYEKTRKKYVPQINTSKKPRQIGGTYYGRTELISTVGTQFKKVVGYTQYEYAGRSYYDFAFEVGGVHASDFGAFKKAFMADVKIDIEELLERQGFVQENRFFVKGNLRILYVDEVGYGTHYSTYCGIRIYMKDSDSYKENRISKKWLQEQMK